MTSSCTARLRCSLAPLGHSCSSFWYIHSQINKPVPWAAIFCQGSDRLYLFKIPSSYLLLSNEFHCYPLELWKGVASPSRYLSHCLSASPCFLVTDIDLSNSYWYIVCTIFTHAVIVLCNFKPAQTSFPAKLNIFPLLFPLSVLSRCKLG